MISIVDYGMGNLRSVEKALEKLGCATRFVGTPEEVASAESIILPGVGAFGDAMAELRRQGLVEPLRAFASGGRPMMGICLGLQVFFDYSEEAPGVEGLSLLPGTVRRIPPNGLKIPHMGWNSLAIRGGSRLFAGIGQGTHVYFVHSFHVVPDDETVVAASCDYGGRVVAAVERGALWGTQFHPEKSQDAGLRILGNFAAAAAAAPTGP